LGEALKFTSLDRFYEQLAYKPWCGDDKAARLVRPKASAVTKPYIAPNSPSLISWLVFDLDHSNSWIWEDKNLPEPNLIVSTAKTGRSHLYYAISPVCMSDNARQKPIEYMNAVYRGLAQALDADEAYTGRIAKNPLCPHWRTLELHSYQYNLDDLAEVVKPISKPFFTPQDFEDVEGRNSTLFLQLRYWAYTQVLRAKSTGSYDQWLDEVMTRAYSLSHVEIDFRENEIEGVARSVAKWTWNKYTGPGVDRGVMGLKDSDLPLVNRQRLAARRTHSMRVNATERRISKAIKQLASEGTTITKTAVAKLVQLSRKQLSSRYAYLFEELSLENTPKKEAQAIQAPNVTFAVHQISAALSRPFFSDSVEGVSEIIDTDYVDDS
jgi:hypothetical protein